MISALSLYLSHSHTETMANENEPAKLLLPYLQRADELQKHEPLVAYYCRLYAMQRGLKIPTSDRTKTTKALLVSLMNQLEKRGWRRRRRREMEQRRHHHQQPIINNQNQKTTQQLFKSSSTITNQTQIYSVDQHTDHQQ